MKFYKNLKIIVAIIIIFISLAAIINCKYLFSHLYKTDISPDGNYALYIYKYPSFHFHFPGQGSDGNGYITLIDLNSMKKLKKKCISLVNSIDTIVWTPESVSIGKFISFSLPNTYWQDEKNRKYFFQKHILEAVDTSDSVLIRTYLSKGGTLDAKSTLIKNPLYCAAIKKDTEMIKFLLKQGDFLKRINENKNGILSDQLIQFMPFIAKFLITQGLNPNNVNEYGYSPLYVSIQSENFEMFTILMESRGDKNFKNADIQSLLKKTSLGFQKKVNTFIRSVIGTNLDYYHKA